MDKSMTVILERRESRCIEQIVWHILGSLDHRKSCKVDKLIGVESRVQKVKSLLATRSDNVRFVGIWGMGGIGKTTIARTLFSGISHQFDGCSFVVNVSESAKNHGLHSLQEKVLSDILKEQRIKILSVEEGIDMLCTRLCHKKVLLILDDVDHIDQIQALAAEHSWFGKGSRIIITTRDKHILLAHELNKDDIYETDLLHNDEAMELFARNAFKKSDPTKMREVLSHKAVQYAGGLPLALKVLGSFLCSRDVAIWISALDRLGNVPEDGILKVLELSYNGLKDIEKEIFLDIACFFKGHEMEVVTRKLKSFDFYPEIGINVLIEKSLITVSNKRIQMHDLIQEMGWHIVRQRSRDEPGKLSRLWLLKDICDVLTTNTGTKKLEGITLDSCQEMNFSAGALTNMAKLRLLEISSKFFRRKPTNLPNKLRWLCWGGYPFETLPAGFKELVGLEMCCSNIKELWNGQKDLHHLKFINLTGSGNLISFPDVTGTPNLERLVLKDCDNLVMVHPSLGYLQCLVFLNLKNCRKLSSFPTIINMKSLKILILSGCESLCELPTGDFRPMGRLKKLYLDGSGIEKLPTSIRYLTGLNLIDLSSCTRLIVLPDTICELNCLKTLNLSHCESLKKLPDDIGSIRCLEKLLLTSTDIKELPNSIKDLKNLQTISLSYKDMAEWSMRPFFNPMLSGLCSLRELDLSYCELLEEMIPHDLTPLSSLEELNLTGNKISLLPASICQLSQLKVLLLSQCIHLESLQQLPKRLQVLEANYCESLGKIEILSKRYTSLYKISYINCHKLRENCQSNNHIARMFQLSFVQRRAAANNHYGIIVPGNKVPRWFSQQFRGDQLVLELPSDWQNKIMGFAVCLVCDRAALSDYIAIHFRILKDGKLRIKPSSSRNTCNEPHLWLGYISLDLFNLSYQNIWQECLSGSEKVYLSIDLSDVKAKKCGMQIIYREDVERVSIKGSHISKCTNFGFLEQHCDSEDEEPLKSLPKNMVLLSSDPGFMLLKI